MTPEGETIQFSRPAIVDRAAHRAYVVGHDSTECAYVVAVEYDKRPAPLTLYYTDPLKDFGFITPVLTPEGDLVITGGLAHDNFYPFSAVWLLPVSGKEVADVYAAMAAPVEASHSHPIFWWVLGGLLLLAVVAIAVRRFASLTNVESDDLRGGTTKQSRNDMSSLPRFARKSGFDDAKRVNDLESRPNPAMEALLARITQLMVTQRVYQNPELKLADVAKALGVHRNMVSACINARGGTFSQLVNDYRVQHAKELLSHASDMKITAIGLESGFANERTFFRVFKNATGQPPKEWAKNH
jgi:AraC-like DNA-binding protein